MKNDKYSDALSGLSTAPVGSPLRNIRDLNTNVDELNRQAAATNQVSGAYPTTFLCMWNQMLYNGAYFAYTRTINTGQPFCVYWFVAAATAVDADEYTVVMPLAAGSYYLEIFYVTDDPSGIVDIYFDDVAISTSTDMFTAGSPVYNNRYIQAFTCASDGSHTLKIKLNGKNASATDYQIFATSVQIYPAS